MNRTWIILAPLLLVGVAALLFLLPSDNTEQEVLEKRGLQIVELDDPEGPTTKIVTVSPESIPTSMKERTTAPSISLLPHRSGYPEMKGEVSLPPGEAQQIKAFVHQLLRAWETYMPGDPRYSNKLAPFINQDSRVDERVDSVDPPQICPSPGCTKGSLWHEGENFNNSVFLIDWQDPLLYIVAYGAVKYISAEGFPEGSATRSYGIIIKKTADGWQAERIAAENIS